MIVVAGEALVDLIATEGSHALEAVAGGSPYNTARAIARLGLPCRWIGGLSSDRFGRMLEAGLASDGVRLDLVQRTDLPTTLALAEVGRDGSASYRFYTEGTSAPAVHSGPLEAGLPAATRALLVGSIGLVLEPVASTLERLAGGLDPDVVLMLDPNARPSITPDLDAWRARLGRILGRTDIVKASTEDLALLRSGETPEAAVRWLLGAGPAVVLATDGPGDVLVGVAGTVHRVPATPVAVVDTVGAGDTFGGAFLACLVHRGVGRAGLTDAGTILGAVRFALRASAAVCARRGADPPTLADLGGWPA